MENNTASILEKLIIIGDRVLIKPLSDSEKTLAGLYLPPGVQEKEQVRRGYVMKAGPGYPVPIPVEDETWKKTDDNVRYIPLQVKEGDLALYLQRDGVEVIYSNEKYFIVPQHSILLVERDEELLH
ncbi:MAG: co-chaperone GroES [Ignavibacteria bacterium]|jgi:chaperonin GroES|nr:co-chaperone GroES [Ignavibacteria bacterium]MBK6878877.1 co-chaperone GroES [Ignavibacteria bacterium]